MLMVYSQGLAVALLMISLFCLGTWPAFLAHAEHRGRKPPHAFLDYAFTFLVTALVATMMFGTIGTVSPNIADQLKENNGPCVGWAVAGGILLMMGNLSLQYGIAMVGMTVCLPLQASLTVIIGTVLNYFLDDKLNKASILFPGVGCFMIAIILDAFAHSANSKAQMARLKTSSGGDVERPKDADVMVTTDGGADGIKSPPNDYSVHSNDMAMIATMGDTKTAEMRSLSIKSKNKFAGVLVSAIGGCCFGFFGPAFNLATNDQFNLLAEGVRPLTVWTGYFYFAIAFVSTAVIINIFFLYHPPFGMPKSSFMLYLKDNNMRWSPIIAGFICSVGNILQFLGGQAAGYAASDVVQAYPLWSTILGYFWFKEYRNSSKQAYFLLLAMWLAYLAATALLASSAQLRT